MLRSLVAAVRLLLLGVAMLLAVSTIVAAQGPTPFSREWYAQFTGPYSQPVEPFRIVGNIYDIVLVGHPQSMFARTIKRMRKGERPHPLLNGAEAWTRQLATAEANFERRVADEQRPR